MEDVVDLTNSQQGENELLLIQNEEPISQEETDQIKRRIEEIDEERELILAQIESLKEKASYLNCERTELQERLHELSPQKNEKKILSRQLSSPSKIASFSRDNSESAKDLSKDFPWHQKLMDKMSLFGIHNFRGKQKEAINAILSGKDTFLIMPTGGGKSLCYQLPAVVDESGLTLVISPLLSLIQDQVTSLKEKGINAKSITSQTSKSDQTKIYEEMTRIPCHLKILYITPEKFVKSKMFFRKLSHLYTSNQLSRIAIDEVHCCSAWGHDFRPDYRKLAGLRTNFPRVPIIALTATATENVISDVKQVLKINHCVTLKTSLDRPNLYFEVRPKTNKILDEICEFIHSTYPMESGIVYCFSKKETEEVAQELQNRGVKSEPYHADLAPNYREKIHLRWSKGITQVVVATIAFGMGIDKPNVRFVIHHTMSKSIESYFQESGRAGRDGKDSHCLLFYKCSDLTRQISLCYSEGCTKLFSLVKYCQELRKCRRVMLFEYFGEKFYAETCGKKCDNCQNSKNIIERDITDFAKTITRIIEDANKRGKITSLQLVDAWRGNKSKNISIDFVSANMKKDVCERIVNHLLVEGVIQEKVHANSYNVNVYLIPGKKAKSLWSSAFQLTFQFEEETKKRKARTGNKKSDFEKSVEEFEVDFLENSPLKKKRTRDL